jgi:hypothetical protein
MSTPHVHFYPYPDGPEVGLWVALCGLTLVLHLLHVLLAGSWQTCPPWSVACRQRCPLWHATCNQGFPQLWSPPESRAGWPQVRQIGRVLSSRMEESLSSGDTAITHQTMLWDFVWESRCLIRFHRTSLLLSRRIQRT